MSSTAESSDRIGRGRRGEIATAYLGVLVVVFGLGLMKFAERYGVVPAYWGS